MKQEFKSGISLIAVLMFMLAATTASIVVYKWISSENFASGARLKQSEAYQAAESGVDAAQAWLSNKGADVGGLVTAYFKQTERKPIKLTDDDNNILGRVRKDEGRQNFDVYLVGVDTSIANAPYYKFKFLSVGEGRDSSKVKLTAIFDVAGLYQTNVPTQVRRSIPVDFDWQYFGGSISFSGDKQFSSAAISGDWTGNPPRIEKDFIVTGNLNASASMVTVGGTLCVGGSYNPNNNADVKDAYIGSSTNFIGKYENVYCEGEMKMGTASGTAINGSLTLNGRLHNFTSNAYQIGGDMVIGEAGYIDDAGMQDAGRFSVCGSVWSSNAGGVHSSQANGAKILFNEGTNCPANNNAILAFKDASISSNTLYKTGELNAGNPVGYFTSSKANNFPTNANKPQAANPVKNYCDEVWKPVGSGESGCAGSQYVIDDPIASSLSDIKDFLDKIKDSDNTKVSNFQCVSDIIHDYRKNNGVPRDTINAINGCYDALEGSNKLYNGYLIVKLNQTQDFQPKDVALDGKFIFIYPEQQNANVFLPPTTRDSKVMVFFENGVNSDLISAGCVKNPNGVDYVYNYFIYSLKNIKQLNSWNQNCPLEGNIYFPSGSCAKVETVNNEFKVVSNKDLIRDLMESGILCNRGDGTGDCTEDEIRNTQGQIDPNGTENADYNLEPRWLPVSSRLKVSLVSKNISREKAEEENPIMLEKSVVVMPRVLRLAKNAYSLFPSDNNPLSHFYTFMYLNGAKVPTQKPVPQCESVQGGSAEWKETGELSEGFFVCKFTDNMYSDFHVVVKGEMGGASVGFALPEYEIKNNESDKCKDVNVIATENHNNFSLRIRATLMGSGWTVTEVGPNSKCRIEPGSDGIYRIYNVTCEEEITDNSTIATFKTCSTNELDDMVVLFNIEYVDGVIVGQHGTSKVQKEAPDMEITRINMDGIVSCPDRFKSASGNPWITLTCSVAPTYVNTPNSNWTCPLVPVQTATYQLTPPAGCELPQNVQPSGSVNEVSSAAQSYSTSAEPFKMDLAWKSYTVSVEGGSLSFTTTDTEVPENERTSNGSKLYHGATYTISYGGTPKQATCDQSLDCNASPMYLPAPAGGIPRTITPTGNGTIRLTDVVPPTAQCEQSIPQQKAGVPFKFSDIAPIVNIVGYECDAAPWPMISYSVSPGGEYSGNANVSNLAAGNYALTATVTCDNRTSQPLACGALRIVEAVQPAIECAWDGKSVWYVGQEPKLKVTVTNGEVILCSENPVLKNITGSQVFWPRSGTQNTSTPGAVSPHIFTGHVLEDSDKGDYNSGSLQASITCGSTTLTAACPAYTVQDAPPCGYKKEFCNGAEYGSIKSAWSSTAGCYFVSSINSFQNGSSIKINGINFNITCGHDWGANDKIPCATRLNENNITEVDGGYYVYQSGGLNNANMTPAAYPLPQCLIPTAACTWAGSGKTMFTGDAKPNDPAITCSSGANASIEGLQNEPSSPMMYEGTYNLIADVKCGNTAIKDIDCGTLTVLHKPSIIGCAADDSHQEVTLPSKPVPPSITLNDLSNVCSGVNSGNWIPTWTVSKGGTNASGTWSNIFTEAGEYTFISVSGKCGSYPANLEHGCSGSATVNPALLPPCNFQQSWCPGVSWDEIMWGVTPNINTDAAKFEKCYFMEGNSSSGCNGCNINPGDGGYYVYFNNNSNNNHWNLGNAKAKPTNCIGP